MNPSLYDILGVSPSATRDQIKVAWRDAADRFEPGSGGSSSQFRLFNEAAEVLLDPERRKEYDAQLGAAQKPAQKPAEKPAAVVLTEEPAAPPPPAPEDMGVPADAGQRGEASQPAEKRPARGVPVWALFVLGLVAGALLGAVVYVGLDYTKAKSYQEALDDAPQAAERAAAAVLSYDFERLDADRDAAAKFLTPGYRDKYVSTFDEVIKAPAVQIKARVEADVLANSTMVDTLDSRDPDKVRVLIFVDQTTVSTANSGEPRTALNRVRLDMVNVDGTWLVDDITSY